MPTYSGTVKRVKPRVNVMRGYTGNEPQSLSRSAPCSSTAKDFIKSGQAIALDGSEEWILATKDSAVVYIAYHDSEDTDVLSCGKLMGFSTLGSYELETAYTTSAGLAAATGPDLAVKVSTTAGSLTIDGFGNGAGPALGRTSTAAVDLSGGGKLVSLDAAGGVLGGTQPLGEDDSSDAWGSSGAASGGDIGWAIATIVQDDVDVTLSIGGSDYVVPTVAFNTDANTTVGDIKTAIDTLVLATQALDAAIKTVTVATNVITITTHAGTANNVVLTAASDDVNDTIVATDDASGTQGTDATATTNKQVLRWITTAS